MGKFLYNLTITPVQYVIDIIFSVLSRFFDSYGIAIIGVSLVVQLLVFPLYKKSDAIQEAEREKQKSMEKWVSHIRKTFRGNERFMMLSTYYRQQNYKPIYALKGSVSLLLQIPFFIAAYNFLSNLPVLNGQSFLFLNELSKPDALISLGSITINVMPILMTVINIASGTIYTKGFSVKEKVQLYGMAGIFLIILYNSPSGLVLYWTMNNLFSLIKNIIMKCLKHPRRFINIVSATAGVAFLVFKLWFSISITRLEIVFFIIVLIAGFIPALLSALSAYRKCRPAGQKTIAATDNRVFLLVSVFLALFIGLMIPISTVKASPSEFAMGRYSPLELVFSAFSVMIGFFVVWGNVYYHLGTAKIKSVFMTAFCALSIAFAVDFFFFGTNTGTISSSFVFNKYPYFSTKEQVVNLAVLLAVCVPGVILVRKKPIVGRYAYSILSLAVISYAIVASIGIKRDTVMENAGYSEDEEISPVFHLSRNGKNVVLLMLDRAIGAYVPFIMNEKPEVADAFSDFTFYPNTISFGPKTNLGSPALFGGYEYTPTEINKRSDEMLVDKQNEALKMLPVIFNDNGYKVTVCDPPCAGYRSVPDVKIYSDYPEIQAFNLKGRYSYLLNSTYETRENQKRSLFFYSVMKSMPLIARNYVYDDGYYWSASMLAYNVEFIESASTLFAFRELTGITDAACNTFLMIANETTHATENLTYPDYLLNTKPMESTRGPACLYDSEGNVLDISVSEYYMQYDVNVYAYMRLAEWIGYLKENGVYDNTRIIIVADHGEKLGQFDYMMHKDGFDVEAVNPVLMFKDFDSHSDELTTSYEFMTNGDTPVLLLDNLIEDPVNPFTGKPISNIEKTAHPQIVTSSTNWVTDHVTSNVFDTSDGRWYSVHDNIFVEENWEEVK